MLVETSNSGERVNNATPDSDSLDTAKRVAQLPKLREASFEDYPRIAALQIANGLSTKPYEEWKHQWMDNFAYLQSQTRLPIGWVLENDKKIVGSLGNIPLFYELDGKRLLASVAHAWAVDAQYRGYALWLVDRYFSQKTVELFLNATVGPSAAESFAIFESSRVPSGEWGSSAFAITRYRECVTSLLVMKGVPLARVCSYPLALGISIKDKLAKPRLSQCETGLEVKCCFEFDDRFDVFWNALRSTNPHVLRAVRTKEILEWHFRYGLRNKKVWIVTTDQGAVLKAYAIFLRQDNPAFGLKRMRLVDFQTLDGNTTPLLPMLLWAVQRCRKEGIAMLESIGFCADKTKVISKVLTYKRRLPSWLYFYKTRDKSLGERLGDPNAWDPSQFDGDASL